MSQDRINQMLAEADEFESQAEDTFPSEEPSHTNNHHPYDEEPIQFDPEPEIVFQTLSERRSLYERDEPKRKPEIIDGLLRQGETMLITASPKIGKSWAVMQLAVAAVNNQPWLGKFNIQQSEVLILDNELHQEELDYRADVVTRGMLQGNREQDGLVLQSLRGNIPSLAGLRRYMEAAGDRFGLIILDCLYRFKGVNESDPEKMKDAFNLLDNFAFMTGASIVVIHHNTKGEQGHKSITDMGSGSGVLTRAPDTVAAVRAHEDEEMSVFDFTRRSGTSPESFSARLEWPIWRADDEIEPVLKQPLGRGDLKQQKDDEDGKRKIRESFQRRKTTRNAIRTDIGMGLDRINRLLRQMLDDGEIRITGTDTNRNGTEYEIYELTQDEAGLDEQF